MVPCDANRMADADVVLTTYPVFTDEVRVLPTTLSLNGPLALTLLSPTPTLQHFVLVLSGILTSMPTYWASHYNLALLQHMGTHTPQQHCPNNR